MLRAIFETHNKVLLIVSRSRFKQGRTRTMTAVIDAISMCLTEAIFGNFKSLKGLWLWFITGTGMVHGSCSLARVAPVCNHYHSARL